MKKWAFLVAMLLLTGSLSIPLSASATDVPVDTEVTTTLTEIQEMTEATEATTSPAITEPIEDPSSTEVVASDFSVEPSVCNLTVGESCNLNVKFDKEGYDTEHIEYQSADESIATVSKYGLVTAISAGETCIRIFVFDEADNPVKTIPIPVVIAPDDTMSTEQQEQLAALKEKGSHLFGEFIREEKIILGELPPDTARLCFDDVQEILANNTDFQNIYESLLSIAKYPDFVGGSGVTLVEFWLDDYGTEKILLILEQEDVISVKCNADGNISDWKPLYSEEKAETTATTATTETTTTTATVTSDALSEEQAKALAELAEKEHGVFGEFERARASILNKIPEDASRMTLEEAKEFVNSSDSFKEIYDKLSASQPYPDFIGGSGVTKVEYWFDDKGKEKILLILEQEDVIYVDCTKQGDVSKWERLYPVSDVEDSNIKDSNLAGTYKIYNGIDELAVAVTTEAPVIAGTVVTTDTPPQITSNVSETSMTTTVTDEYGNYIDEEGNITPATTSVSTQTETTTTTTKASTELSQIPLSGTYTVRIRIRDIVRQTPVLGLNCEVFCLQTGDVVAKWNTSDVDEIYIENLKYEFNSYNSYTGNIRYAIRITNMPENYVFFYGKDKEVYGLTGFDLEEFEYGTDLDCTVKLEDTSDDAPKYTYVTGTHPIVTTSTAPVADTTEPISNTTAPKDTGTTISIPVTDPETSVTPVPGTTAPTETNTTVTTKTTETLPQTGYSNGYRWLIGAAVLMTVTGAGIVLRTKKETK